MKGCEGAAGWKAEESSGATAATAAEASGTGGDTAGAAEGGGGDGGRGGGGGGGEVSPKEKSSEPSCSCTPSAAERAARRRAPHVAERQASRLPPERSIARCSAFLSRRGLHSVSQALLERRMRRQPFQTAAPGVRNGAAGRENNRARRRGAAGGAPAALERTVGCSGSYGRLPPWPLAATERGGEAVERERGGAATGAAPSDSLPLCDRAGAWSLPHAVEPCSAVETAGISVQKRRLPGRGSPGASWPSTGRPRGPSASALALSGAPGTSSRDAHTGTSARARARSCALHRVGCRLRAALPWQPNGGCRCS